MATVPPTTPPPGLPSVTGTPSAGTATTAPPKAGKRTRYIENNQIGSSADRLRQMLGRYWVAGDPAPRPTPTSPTTGVEIPAPRRRGSRAEYGVDPVKMPIIVKVGKTSAIDKTTECPFVKYKNSIRIEPNPAIFKPNGYTDQAVDSFRAFLYGTGMGGIKLLAFTPFWNLVPHTSPTAYADTSPEFDAFLEEYDILRKTAVTGEEYLWIPGILRGCSEFGGMAVRDPEFADRGGRSSAGADAAAFFWDVPGAPEGDDSDPDGDTWADDPQFGSAPWMQLDYDAFDPQDSGMYDFDIPSLYDPQAGETLADPDDPFEVLDVPRLELETDEEGSRTPPDMPYYTRPPEIDPPTGCCDTTFEIVTPFSQFALDHFDLQSNVMFSGLTFSYNYTNEVYNIFAADPDKEEKDLPNLYLTLEDAKAGRFLRTATSKDVCSHNIDHLIEVPTGYKNILSPAKSSVVLPEAVPYSEYFPFHSDLQFTTDRDAEFADVLAKRKMEGHMLRRLNEGPSTPCSPTPATVPEERTRNMGVDTVIIESDVIKKTISTKARPFYNTNLPAIDFCEWFDGSAACFDGLSMVTRIPENTRIIGPSTHSKVFADPHHHGAGFASTLRPARAYEFNLLKYLAAEYANKHFGGYRQLLQTGINHSETIAYKVMKWDAETYDLKKNDPAGTYQPLQKFYFSNTSDLDYVHYIDTQIKYNKRYVYETKAYQLVLGTKYRYDRCVSWFRGAHIPEQNLPQSGGTLTKKQLPWYWFKRLKELEDKGPPAGTSPKAFEADIQRLLRGWIAGVALKYPTYMDSFPGQGKINNCEESEIIYQVQEIDDVGLFVRVGCVCDQPSNAPGDPSPPSGGDDPPVIADDAAMLISGPIAGGSTIVDPLEPGGVFCPANPESSPSPRVPHETLDVISEPCIRIYETPYTIFDGRLVEHPPVRPLVDLVPYRAVNNQMLINLSNGMGVESQIPIYINPNEELAIQERLRTENFFRQKVDYKSHPGGLPPSGFEIYRMTDPPKNYQDFSGHLRAFVSTDFDKLSRQAADNASFIDDMVPNQKYYYTFRTIGATDLSNVDEMLEAVEEHGYYAGPVYTMHSFSNPTPVYEVELVDDDGAVYLLIRTVDFDILHPPPTHKTMKRLLHVKPTMTQSLPKFGTIDDLRWSDTAEDGRPISRVVHPGATALDAVEALSGTVPLGLENVSIWGKTFKIRLTSRETCRKLDLNVKLDTKYIRADECNQVSIVGVPYDADEEV